MTSDICLIMLILRKNTSVCQVLLVYDPLHIDTTESDYDPAQVKPVWGNRSDFSYNEDERRNGMCDFSNTGICVILPFIRYPFVIGAKMTIQNVWHSILNMW